MIREEPCPRCLGTGYVDLYPPSANLRSPCDLCGGKKKILHMIEEPPSLSEQVIDLRKRIEVLEKHVDWDAANRNCRSGPSRVWPVDSSNIRGVIRMLRVYGAQHLEETKTRAPSEWDRGAARAYDYAATSLEALLVR